MTQTVQGRPRVHAQTTPVFVRHALWARIVQRVRRGIQVTIAQHLALAVTDVAREGTVAIARMDGQAQSVRSHQCCAPKGMSRQKTAHLVRLVEEESTKT